MAFALARLKLFAVGVVAVSMTGCVFLQSTRVGQPAASKGTGCPIEYLQLALADTVPEYTQVGSLCIGSTPGEVYDREEQQARQAIEKSACALGGTMVSVIGGCTIHRAEGTEVGVFRPRVPSVAPEPTGASSPIQRPDSHAHRWSGTS